MLELGVKSLMAYLLGSLLGSLILGRLRGVDIRRCGSATPGDDALRTQGKLFGLAVLLIDAARECSAVLYLPGAACPPPIRGVARVSPGVRPGRGPWATSIRRVLVSRRARAVATMWESSERSAEAASCRCARVAHGAAAHRLRGLASMLAGAALVGFVYGDRTG